MNFYVNLHTHTFLNQDTCIEIVNNYPNETIESNYFSSGIHPWYINDNWESELKILHYKLSLPKNIALGECGLDNRVATPMALQEEVFIAQLKIAQNANKPLIIHCVGAFQEIIALKKKFDIRVPMIIHGYSKNLQLAQQLIKHNFYLSFGKNLLLNPALSVVFTEIPITNIFLETDSSTFSIEEVYAKAAALKSISILDLQEKIFENFNAVFKSLC